MGHSDDRGRFRPCQEDALDETQLRQTPGAEKGRVPWAAEQPGEQGWGGGSGSTWNARGGAALTLGAVGAPRWLCVSVRVGAGIWEKGW